MWIKVDHPALRRWKPSVVDEWVDITTNQTAQVSDETGEKLIANYDIVTKHD